MTSPNLVRNGTQPNPRNGLFNGLSKGSLTGSSADGLLWDYISPTRLNLWLRCPLAFRLRYVEGIKTPSTPGLFLGKQVHAGLEIFYRNLLEGTRLAPQDVIAEVDRDWPRAVDAEQIAFKSTSEEQALRRQLAALLEAYFQQRPRDEPPPLSVEQRFVLPLTDPATGEPLGIDLVGIVDLVLDGPDGPVIVDFKTAARAARPPSQVHEIQLGCYALLVRGALNTSEAGLEIRSLIKTRVPQINIHCYPPRTDAHRRRLSAAIRAYLADLRQGNFVYRPGFACGFCDYRQNRQNHRQNHCQNHCQDWQG